MNESVLIRIICFIRDPILDFIARYADCADFTRIFADKKEVPSLFIFISPSFEVGKLYRIENGGFGATPARFELESFESLYINELHAMIIRSYRMNERLFSENNERAKVFLKPLLL